MQTNYSSSRNAKPCPVWAMTTKARTGGGGGNTRDHALSRRPLAGGQTSYHLSWEVKGIIQKTNIHIGVGRMRSPSTWEATFRRTGRSPPLPPLPERIDPSERLANQSETGGPTRGVPPHTTHQLALPQPPMTHCHPPVTATGRLQVPRSSPNAGTTSPSAPLGGQEHSLL